MSEQWRRERFALQPPWLLVMAEGTTDVQGRLSLPGGAVDILMEEDLGGHELGMLVRSSGGVELKLRAETEEEYGRWVSALTNTAQREPVAGATEHSPPSA